MSTMDYILLTPPNRPLRRNTILKIGDTIVDNHWNESNSVYLSNSTLMRRRSFHVTPSTAILHTSTSQFHRQIILSREINRLQRNLKDVRSGGVGDWSCGNSFKPSHTWEMAILYAVLGNYFRRKACLENHPNRHLWHGSFYLTSSNRLFLASANKAY